jgi:hypothetical protein
MYIDRPANTNPSHWCYQASYVLYVSLYGNNSIREIECIHSQQYSQSSKKVWYKYHLTTTIVATKHADSAAAVQNHRHCRLSSRRSRRLPTSVLSPRPIPFNLKNGSAGTSHPNIRFESEEGAGICLLTWQKVEGATLNFSGVKVKFASSPRRAARI